jgi:hypothetical protein
MYSVPSNFQDAHIRIYALLPSFPPFLSSLSPSIYDIVEASPVEASCVQKIELHYLLIISLLPVFTTWLEMAQMLRLDLIETRRRRETRQKKMKSVKITEAMTRSRSTSSIPS